MTFFDPRHNKKPSRDIRQLSLLTTVPAIMLAAPLIGYFIGDWVDGKLGTEPYLAAAGALLGIAAAGIETYRIIKKASAMNKDRDNERKPET